MEGFVVLHKSDISCPFCLFRREITSHPIAVRLLCVICFGFDASPLSGLKAHSRTSLALRLRKRKYPHVSPEKAPAVLSGGRPRSTFVHGVLYSSCCCRIWDYWSHLSFRNPAGTGFLCVSSLSFSLRPPKPPP